MDDIPRSHGAAGDRAGRAGAAWIGKACGGVGGLGGGRSRFLLYRRVTVHAVTAMTFGRLPSFAPVPNPGPVPAFSHDHPDTAQSGLVVDLCEACFAQRRDEAFLDFSYPLESFMASRVDVVRPLLLRIVCPRLSARVAAAELGVTRN
jgi:hypothetical protein